MPFECFVIISSSACGQESACSSLVKHRAWNHQRTPFQQRLGAQTGTIFAAGVADFFSNMARKVVDFQSLVLGVFFVAVFGQAC